MPYQGFEPGRKKPSPHWGLKPMSVSRFGFQSDVIPTELCLPLPCHHQKQYRWSLPPMLCLLVYAVLVVLRGQHMDLVIPQNNAGSPFLPCCVYLLSYLCCFCSPWGQHMDLVIAQNNAGSLFHPCCIYLHACCCPSSPWGQTGARP